jgi:AraC-like DNA-binding protein
MDSITDMLFFPQLFKCGFMEKANCSRDDLMVFSLRRSYGEGTCLLKPVGKGVVVCVTDYNCQRSVEVVWEQPEYFHISLWHGTIKGILEHIGRKRQCFPVGFHHCAISVSFLPEFFDALLGLRHGVSRDELEQAIGALSRFPPPPDASVVLKQMGDAACYGGAGNAWFEAKTLELVSVVLDWHRRLKTTPSPRLREDDRAAIAEVLCYIGEHSGDTLSLETLAKRAAMSVSKFTAAFKIHTGLAAAEYIHRLRLEKALGLLKKTSTPLWKIAGAAGYKNHASFSAAFKEEYGVIPSAFRKKNEPPKNPLARGS